ncbi:TetR/AcrR family transcriptional regulator [Streptomyces sp. TRM66268-LWL]|uniref:TetR/AcrR family transcriptional regulator n=1 Tax=Streptomyces polyasparticus TaxID=2767826 RepID=A0ABR7SEV1_9ACTN|nr:TetR/AcrR family transcriptional regulator [Streptomyces polyasparticus]MBC9714031.1 TetR/AcrR family transcriptional regulator [Streptomyces polyasparticus]
MVRAAERAKHPATSSIWLDSERRGRTRRDGQPDGLDRDKIVETSIRMLDAEGLAKFSMRKLAAELNVTAMSVYWYVDTKDDILELALDAAFAEIDLPDPDRAIVWRDDLRALAESYRAMLVRHPWVGAIYNTYLNIGPHALLVARAVQDITMATGLPPAGQAGAITAVFQFVYGFGTTMGNFRRKCEESGITQDEYFEQALAVFRTEPELEDTLERAKPVMEARGGATVDEMWERDFRFGLDVLIAGIETMVDRAAGA